MENRHQRLKELSDDIRGRRAALHLAPICYTFKGTNPTVRLNSLSGVTLDKRINWSLHIDHFSWRDAQSIGFLCSLLNKWNELCQERSHALQAALPPHDGLRIPHLEVRCPHIRSRLQVLQSKFLRLVTGACWYLSNRQIHEYLAVPPFADHFRTLTASFDSELADVGPTSSAIR
jgi:hypothetical protein